MPEPEGHDEVDVDAAVGDYDGWLTRQPLAARTRDAYLAQARDFVSSPLPQDLAAAPAPRAR